ncbi:MAG TPA: polysaccharide pyruvyl transferase family protein [Flavobacterium sp.]|nr:polysaccharide pyruvyl transferase family protein [Flavobacterium sp.]
MNLFKSIQRNITKRRVVNTILEAEQYNNDVVNIHRIDKKNIGDFYCAPHHYFDVLNGKSMDIFDYKSEDKEVRENFINKISNRSLIIGGGGLLNRESFAKQMKMFEKLSGKGKKIVLWGVGHNEKKQKLYGKISNYNINIENFGLIGTRDYNMPTNYVPCVSCMNTIFDQNFEVKNEVGIVFHKNTLKKENVTKKYKNFATSSNTTNLEDLIQFIGNSENIITDSYHTMYWAMLMNKKVIAIPNSSKFYDFKYQPIISTFDDALNHLNKGQIYSGILEECRELNLEFAEKAFNYLNL